jgi:hypothetical protein
MKIKEEVNIKVGLLSCNVSAWQREMAQSKARASEKAKKEQKCREREREQERERESCARLLSFAAFCVPSVIKPSHFLTKTQQKFFHRFCRSALFETVATAPDLKSITMTLVNRFQQGSSLALSKSENSSPWNVFLVGFWAVANVPRLPMHFF